MADETELIRNRMDDTRASMTDKVETLEKQVTETVQETAQTVAETVSTATEAVDQTLEAISETVETVTETFDISGHIQNHPWLAFGGAVAVGYLFGSMMSANRSAAAPAAALPPEPAHDPDPVEMAETEAEAEIAPEAEAEIAPDASDGRPGLGDLLGGLKGLAIGSTLSMFGQVFLNAVPADMRSGLSGLIKDVTESLGGTAPGKQA